MVHSHPEQPVLWPTAPTAEEWAALSPEEREATVARLHAMAVPDELIEAMSEGDDHLDAKISVRETLRTYFSKSGRRIYIAAELPVFYPGQPVFAPDVLAVRDAEQRSRRSWFVSAEGKGLDLVMEVIASGDRKKDLVHNVERYASLGIAEYFVLDLHRGALHGHHLAGSGRGARYERLVPQAGLFTSEVLGLELGLVGGQLRFYQGSAMLLTAEDLAAKLGRMVDELVVKHEEERSGREQEQARREQEQARREQEQARREQEQARSDQLAQQLQAAILALLAARGLPIDATTRERIVSTGDALLLGRWSVRAATADSIAALFADD